MHTLVDTCKVVKAFVIGESGRGGRTAFDRDRVTAAITSGKLTLENGKQIAEGGPAWREVPVSSDGAYAERELRGGYVALIVKSETDQTVVVRASGHGVFYAPGVVHGGDPYGTDAFHFPVRGMKSFVLRTATYRSMKVVVLLSLVEFSYDRSKHRGVSLLLTRCFPL